MGAKFDELISLKLNEIGDLTAGIFGPLAFLWLVLGYIQQGRELRLSSEALLLQADELRNSVAQQCEMVAAQKIGLINYEKSLQPLLHVSVSDAGWFEGEFYLEFKVENTGEYCESLAVKLVVGAEEIGPNYLQPLIRGASSFVRFSHLDEWTDCKVVIGYRVMNGSCNSQEFTATHYADEEGDQYFVRKLSFLS